MLYNALVLPYFTYWSTVWHQKNLQNYWHTDKLQKLQNRAARIITNLNYEIKSVDILNKLHWKPIKRTLNHRKELVLFKALRNITSINTFQTYFIFVKTTIALWEVRSEALPKPKTNFLKKKFFISRCSGMEQLTRGNSWWLWKSFNTCI